MPVGPRAGLLPLALLLAGCTAAPGRSVPSAETPATAANVPPAALATIGPDTITLAQVEARLGGRLDKLALQYQLDRHRLLDAGLQSLLREQVLEAEATRQGKTLDQLIAAEAGGTLDPSDIEVALWYQENQGRVGGRTLDEIRPQIAELLRKQRTDSASRQLNDRLNRERQVTVLLEPFRVPLDNEGAPARGPANAPVTLVEFSDFQCPFCVQAVATLRRVTEAYGDRVRIVYRQFPIEGLHPQAPKAAEASLCAHEQGQFWAMHDLLFAAPARIDVASLKGRAAKLGLNQRKFDGCLDSGRMAAQVQRDFAAGDAVGVTGTPALFVNGIPLEAGARPFEEIAAVIDKELARRDR